MLNKNFAATSAMIGKAPKMVIEQPHFTKQEDWGQVMSKFLTDYKNQTNENELKSALQSGDEEAINKAAAAYDPKGFYDAMQKIKASREASDLDFERKKELASMNFENALALENIKNRNAIGLKQLEYQGLGNIEGFTPTGNPAYDKAVVAQLAKDNVERQKAIRQVEDMRPAVEGALARADQALLSGKGIGANSAKGMFGDDSVLGQLFSSKEADNNREDINTANSQMNSFLRSKLASTGLTGGELNAAAEAEAYRYTIKPNDSDTSIARKISNFRRDYLGLPELNITASAKPQTSGTQQVGNFKVREIK
jgi:hypothetical protein